MSTDNCQTSSVSRWRSDVDMTAAAANGDTRAQSDLVGALCDRVRRMCLYMARSRSDFEDLAQMSLIEILRSAGSFRGDSSLGRWADRVTVFVICRHFEKLRRRERIWSARGPDDLSWNVDDGTPETSMSRAQLQYRMAALLQTVSTTRRIALVLHHVQGYEISEIAVLTDTPINTVRDRLQVGRRQLRNKILKDPILSMWAGTESFV